DDVAVLQARDGGPLGGGLRGCGRSAHGQDRADLPPELGHASLRKRERRKVVSSTDLDKRPEDAHGKAAAARLSSVVFVDNFSRGPFARANSRHLRGCCRSPIQSLQLGKEIPFSHQAREGAGPAWLNQVAGNARGGCCRATT